MPPAISVVIPLFNKRAYVERCLRSVRNQTFDDYQIVVVNDGSTDGSEKLVEPFLREGDLLINQENAGVSAARNRGMEEASTELFAFLDADDEWMPEHLADIHELSCLFPEAGLLGTGKRDRREGGYVADRYVAGGTPRIVNYFEAAAEGFVAPVDASAVAVRREVFHQLGGFLRGVPFGEDLEFWARVALHWPMALHPAITSVYHRDVEGNVSSHTEADGRSPYSLTYTMLEQALDDGTCPAELRSQVRRFAAHLRLRGVMTLINIGRHREASEILNHESLRNAELRRQVKRLKICAIIARCLPASVVHLCAQALRSRILSKTFTRRYGDTVIKQYFIHDTFER